MRSGVNWFLFATPVSMRTPVSLLLLPVLALVACQPTAQEQKMMEDVLSSSSSAMMQEDDSMMKDEGMMEDDKMMKDTSDDTSVMNDGPTMAPKGSYVSGVTGAEVIAKGEPAVLFFHAPWCPICRQADADITALFHKESFPLSLYKIDYDSEKALRAKYGVTYQHTFVLITGLGEEVKVVQGPTIDKIRELLNS